MTARQELRIEELMEAINAQDAQIDRLRNALRIVAIIADTRGKQLSPYWPPVLCEEGQEELGLLSGDLPREVAQGNVTH